MTEEKKRIFEAESIALLPLKIVLGEAQGGDHLSPPMAKRMPKEAEKAAREDVVLRLIEKLLTKE